MAAVGLIIYSMININYEYSNKYHLRNPKMEKLSKRLQLLIISSIIFFIVSTMMIRPYSAPFLPVTFKYGNLLCPCFPKKKILGPIII